jgi:hypothetical protein
MASHDRGQLRVILGCLQHQQATVKATVPTLMSAAVFADSVLVVTPEADTLVELSEYFEVTDAFQGFFDYVGADSWELNVQKGPYMRSLGLEPRAPVDQTDDEFEWGPVPTGDLGDDPWQEHEQAQLLEVARIVEELIGAPQTLPMIYDPTGVLMSASLTLKTLSKLTKQKQEADAKLGSGLIDTLPSFDQFEPGEIVEIRHRLGEYLAPFRSFVIETSQGLVGTIRDEEATRDVIQEIYLGKVRPALNVINDEWGRSSLGRATIRDFGRDPNAFIQSFVTFGLGQLAQLPVPVSVGAAGASGVISGIAKRHESRRLLRQNKLFFLHEIERLAKGS